ncbi:hypothetical protein NCAS_0B09090 [Naumovozyma castellii]|uniref:Uncharacterized protein n=1 Tax=Naumovozyma castellii TaxID=27288 RepID=G0VAW5_NAUCA|nr:hypothetical protein NCAS_0B09090 [Naumovozyma castellii CBS 4309]CCC68993.1 hypothetical protein NCAS_0B09090 [Naumovozyma castellii CBS 4309]
MARSHSTKTKAATNNRNKTGKNQVKKNKNSISFSDRKKAKHQVEKLNKKENLLPMNVLDLQKKKNLSKKPEPLKSILHARSLLQDQKKDKEIRNKIRAEQKATDDSIEKQIEMISGFTF